MKGLLIALLLLMTGITTLASTASTSSKTLICRMGDIADMDIVISTLENNKESISVIIYEMDGETSYSYTNSNYSDQSITKALLEGNFEAVVSTSDLKSQFGGAYLEAGFLKMKKNEMESAKNSVPNAKPRYDVIFAARNFVYTANCGEL